MWRGVLVVMLCFGLAGTAWAMRTRKPSTYTDLTDPNQLTDLNNFIEDVQYVLNGRYSLENIDHDPNLGDSDTPARQGHKGDLVYAEFGGLQHLCINTSFPASTAWTCINIGVLSTCPGGADTMVQFNDNGTCGGDSAFTFDKNLDHAALGSDGVIDKTFSPDNFGNYTSSSNQILTVSDTRDTWVPTVLQDGITVEMKAEPSAQEGFDGVLLNGISSLFVADGTAGSTATTKWIADSFFGTHFNALTGMFGTGATDSIDLLAGWSVNSDMVVNLSGAGTTNEIDDLIWTSFLDEVTITADLIDSIIFQGYFQDMVLNVPSITLGAVILPFQASLDVNGSTVTDGVVFIPYASDIDITTDNLESVASVHLNIDADYTATANTGQNDVSDKAMVYDFLLDGATTIDGVLTTVIQSTQNADMDSLDDGSSSASWTMYGWLAQQTIGSANDSGTFQTMRGIDLTQTWSGDANGTNVDGAKITGLAKAGTGTVTTATSLNLVAPIRSAGTLTNAYTVQFTVPTTASLENFGLYASSGVSGILVVEGNTANQFETSLDFQEPTTDRRITFPDATGIVVVSAEPISAIAAGVWTPTSNNITNLVSSSAAEGQYIRVGSVVTGSLQLTVDPTLSATATELELDLPVASNFGATSDAAGACGGSDVASEVAEVRADTTSDEMEVTWVTTSLASHEIACSFSYQVIP